jgi:hypothetical protein
MMPADYLAHARYAVRAVIVISIGCWWAFQIGYWIPDDDGVEA